MLNNCCVNTLLLMQAWEYSLSIVRNDMFSVRTISVTVHSGG